MLVFIFENRIDLENNVNNQKLARLFFGFAKLYTQALMMKWMYVYGLFHVCKSFEPKWNITLWEIMLAEDLLYQVSTYSSYLYHLCLYICFKFSPSLLMEIKSFHSSEIQDIRWNCCLEKCLKKEVHNVKKRENKHFVFL